MPDTTPPRRRATWLDEIALATVFMTRLPIRLRLDPEVDLHARSMGWFPLVGAGVGLLAGGVYALTVWLNLPPTAAALLALAASAWVTGALHEDGLADVADGFGGGRSRERKLEIMRDSRVGSYGVLAVVFSVGLRASALAALADPLAAAIVEIAQSPAALGRSDPAAY
ncbi:MAG TPA: adenosylcobinamide-GDP ribazoletransferase, partial [Azospirillum sp.]